MVVPAGTGQFPKDDASEEGGAEGNAQEDGDAFCGGGIGEGHVSSGGGVTDDADEEDC